MAQLRLLLLGTPQIELNREPVRTDRRKAVALLAYLALTATRYSREALATLYWPESDQSRALAYLRRTLWEINQMIGERWLQAERGHAELPAAEGLWLDVREFERLAASEETADLAAAAALYRGDFMAGFTLRDAPEFDQWQYYEAERWRRMLAQILARLVTRLAQQGEWETAVGHARRWLSLDPLHEPAHRQLMTLYAQMGQRAAALRQYESCAQILADELDTSPQDETTALYTAIRANELPVVHSQEVTTPVPERDSPPPAPPVSSFAPVPVNLPLQTTPFVGRQTELAEIRTLLSDPSVRLATLVGPGGSGKTRLAVEAAQRQLSTFPDGVYFVPLAPLNAPEEIVPAIVKALHLGFFREGDRPHEQLHDYLRPRQLLLVLDNFEHLLAGGGARLVSDILHVASGTKIFVTSRMRLGLQGEHLYTVAGMDMPDEKTVARLQETAAAGLSQLITTYSALQFFVENGRRSQSDFTLTHDNLVPLVRICRLVDGMPLAIELAAAWLPLLTPAEIEAEIHRNLDFLATEMQDVPERQRSIRAVFDYSWQLLTPAERAVLPQLTIFQGGFAREAAQRVSGAALQTLMSLVHKSLIWRTENGRFAMHELLRQFAAEKLQHDPEGWLAARDRHSQYYLGFLQQEGRRMQGTEQRAGFDAVEREIENVRAAWLWAMVQQQYDRVVPTLTILVYFYLVRSTLLPGLADLFDMVLEDLEAAALADAATRESKLLYLAILALQTWMMDMDIASPRATELSRKSAARFEEWDDLAIDAALPLALMSTVYAVRVDEKQGLAWCWRSLELARQQESRWDLALALNMIGSHLHNAGVREGVKELLQEGAAISREIGDDLLLAYNLTTLAWVLTDEREFAQALQIDKECQALFERVGDRAGAAYNLWNIGSIYDVSGEYELAADHYRESRRLFVDLGRRFSVAASLGWESQMFQRLGDYETALSLRQRALSLFRELSDELGLAWCRFELGELHRLLGQKEEAERYLQESLVGFERHQLTHGLAFYYRARGRSLLAAGRLDEADAALAQAESLAEDTSEHYWNLAYTLCEQAHLALARRDFEKAQRRFQDALRIADRWASLGIMMVILAGYAHLWTYRKQYETAVVLAALVLHHKATWSETRPMVENVLDTARTRINPNAFQDALARGRQLDVAAVVAALLAGHSLP